MQPRRSLPKDLSCSLRAALTTNDLSLVFQPKINLATGELSGVEALSRWAHPEHGQIEPAVFIPIAENQGLIDQLTEWAFRAALRQWQSWREQGFLITIAVNVSPLSLDDVHFPDFLQRLCQLEGVPCKYITVEITESASQEAVRLMDTLTRFRIKGMNTALDDFGTGYSSLFQLRQLPFTELKIDQCFVKDAASSEDSRVIIRSIIDLAHALGLTVTAEGVETKRVLDLLVQLGCDHAQGYLISKPLRPEELAPWIMKSSARWQRAVKEI